MPTSPAPATLTISLSAIAANYNLIKSHTTAEVGAMLKADAYGLGAKHLFQTLQDAGCKSFFTATPDEAEQLRHLGNDTAIYMLGGSYKGAEDFFEAKNIVPVLNTLEEIELYGKYAKDHKLPLALHFDTGMNRLGLGTDDTAKLLSNLSMLDIFDLKLVMSHFACSDQKDHPMNAAQAKAFSDIVGHFRNVPKSLCNSSAIFRNKDWHHDLLRPGYALFGGNPIPEATNPMRSVVALEARILQTRFVKKGQTAGYGARHIFARDTNIATVAIGYADGFLRSGNDRTKLFWNGTSCPVIGRISMDVVMVDIGLVQGIPPKIGDMIEVLGPNQTIDDLAKDCGTIGYEILTSLGNRYRRVYV